MIKLKEQPTFIEKNSSNNFQAFTDKRILEVKNISNNQKFAIDNAYHFYNQIEKKGNFYNKQKLRKHTAIISFFVFIIVFFFLSLHYFEENLVKLKLDHLSVITCTFFVVTIVGMIGIPLFFSSHHIFYTDYLEEKINIFKNFFDNKYEPISPAQIYYTQNKEISEENFYNSQFWKPMSIEALFHYFESEKK